MLYSFFLSNTTIGHLTIKIDRVDIKRVDSCKYLGVIIDSGLKWKERIDYVRNKLISGVVVGDDGDVL